MPLVPAPSGGTLDHRHLVVAGGAGFVGSHLCETALRAGARVTCLDDESTGTVANIAHLLDHPRFAHVRCDVTRPLPSLSRADVVLHLASPASPVAYADRPLHTLRCGSHGTLHLLELAAADDARFVLASTSEVYGDPEVHPQPEEYWGHVNPVGPRAVYDEAKRFAEAAVVGARSEWSVDAGIVRIFNTYGPRMAQDDGRLVPTFLARAMRGEPLPILGDGLQTRSLCHVDDTVDALLRMAVSTVPGPVNVGNPEEHTVLELAEIIGRAVGRPVRVEHLPATEDDPKRRCPDVTRAREQLGWAPTVGVEEGLRRTVRAALATPA